MRVQVEKAVLGSSGAATEAKKRRLIGLLETENLMVFTEPSLSEAYVNYYGDLIAAVVTLRDERSMAALVDAISTGDMVVSTLVSFGARAVQPVAVKLSDASEITRSAAAHTLTQMLQRSREIATDQHSREVIKDALFIAARDMDPIVRRKAVTGLALLGDADAIATVEDLAVNDPYRDSAPGREGRYPVREAAQEALKSARPSGPSSGR
jgi:hypothetical protein